MISVIICTHNPRLSYLRRVFEALRAQTLSQSKWELLIVDNASDRPVKESLDLTAFPQGYYVREEKLGLSHARLRGIAETTGSLLVFVDDDNVLKPDFLEIAAEIHLKYPMLGAWSGQVIPEFEVNPAKELAHFIELLCIRKLDRDIWGNNPTWSHIPWGAGMCVRRQVAQHYRQVTMNDPLRLSLDHAGTRASCHGDTDLALTSLDLHLGLGLFQDLVLTHLIPERRLNESYLINLAENSAAAFVVLRKIRGITMPELQTKFGWLQRLRYWRAPLAERKAADARERGEKLGVELISRTMR